MELKQIEKKVKELQQAVDDLDERTARIGEEVREARLHAKEAHVGFIENSVELRFFRKEFEGLQKRMRNNTRWLVGVFISIIGLIFSFIGLLVTISKVIAK